MRTTTIKEQGAKLPLGILKGGKLVKDFVLRPHNAKVDRLLNIWREANKGQHIAWEVCKYLSLVVASIGDEALPLDASGDTAVESVNRFMELNFGDVMYLWMYARIMAVEELCEIGYKCPRCLISSKLTIDLWGTEVVAIDDPKEMERWLTLKVGFTLAAGKKSKEVCVRPAPFSSLLVEGATAGSTDSIGYAQLRECIVRLKGVDGQHILTDEEIDTLPKMDWLRLDRNAGKTTGGPKMRTPFMCEGTIEEDGKEPKPCGNAMAHALDWSYDSFFDSSVPLGRLMS